MRTIRIEKTFTVKVWQNIDIKDTTTAIEIEKMADELELAAHLDLSNIGQEIAYGENHDCIDTKMEFI